MTDELYVVHSFENYFSDYKHKKIVIYGKGPKTRLLLDVFSDYNVIGIMDGSLTEGSVYGKEVLSYERAAALKPDIIIVVAQIVTTGLIYERIGSFCFSNHISLYGINGKNLFEHYGTGLFHEEKSEYFDVCEEALKRQIVNHDVISFDVFDTLIMRKTYDPLDVFDIVGGKAEALGYQFEDFKSLRRRAEMENPHDEVNIYEIYDHFQRLTGISAEQKERLLELEIEVEKQVLISRDKMVELFRYALDLGKRVYLISDMYLPKQVIGDILQGLEISGYEDLYVSCDYRKAKWNDLFDVFKERVKGKSYLHIGDNEIVDKMAAKEHGLDAFLVKSARELLGLSTYKNLVSVMKTVNERSMIGMLIAKIFNDPFALFHTAGRPIVERVHDMGYLFAAPIITKFILWLIEEMGRGDYDDILLSARDGYLLERLYRTGIQILHREDVPNGIYFQTSRRICAAASMETQKDIGWLARVHCEFSMEQMLHDRFEVPEDEILPYDDVKYGDPYSYALAHEEKIYRSSAKVRKNYWKYMSKIGLEMGKKYALMDFCAIGTSQYFLSKVAPFELEGLYLCRYHSEYNMVNQVNAKGLYENHSLYATDSFFYERYLFLETMMTSFKPSLASMDEEGNPVYAKEERTEAQLKYVKDMHQAVEEYFNDYIRTLYINGQEIDKEVPDRLYGLISAGYTDERCVALDDLILVDGLGIGRMNFR